MKILLHACCGPCSLEPVRLLLQEGHELSISYVNPNIHPEEEYRHRLDTLLEWAVDEGIEVVEGPYDIEGWMQTAGRIQREGGPREERCRACYRCRLEVSARYAAEHGFQGMGTTLSVSPYQYTRIIAEEVRRACKPFGLAPVVRDFRPYYDNATKRSREMGMYRQNYCGCAFSAKEAEDERRERKAARDAEKARRAAERAPLEAQLEEQRRQKAARQAAYDQKQHAKREMRRKFREQAKAAEKQRENEDRQTQE